MISSLYLWRLHERRRARDSVPLRLTRLAMAESERGDSGNRLLNVSVV